MYFYVGNSLQLLSILIVVVDKDKKKNPFNYFCSGQEKSSSFKPIYGGGGEVGRFSDRQGINDFKTIYS